MTEKRITEFHADNDSVQVLPTTRAIMRANRRRDSAPELAVRRLLHGDGFRYRVDFPIKLPSIRAFRPDIVFPRERIAIFIDGCFWHGCPEHGTRPATNRDYWDPKLDANRERDERQTSALRDAGWTVLRFWEHEPAAAVARKIAAVVLELRST